MGVSGGGDTRRELSVFEESQGLYVRFERELNENQNKAGT